MAALIVFSAVCHMGVCHQTTHSTPARSYHHSFRSPIHTTIIINKNSDPFFSNMQKEKIYILSFDINIKYIDSW